MSFRKPGEFQTIENVLTDGSSTFDVCFVNDDDLSRTVVFLAYCAQQADELTAALNRDFQRVTA